MFTTRNVHNRFISAKFINYLCYPAAVPDVSRRFYLPFAITACLSASATIRSYVSARMVFLKIEPGVVAGH